MEQARFGAKTDTLICYYTCATDTSFPFLFSLWAGRFALLWMEHGLFPWIPRARLRYGRSKDYIPLVTSHEQREDNPIFFCTRCRGNSVGDLVTLVQVCKHDEGRSPTPWPHRCLSTLETAESYFSLFFSSILGIHFPVCCRPRFSCGLGCWVERLAQW